MEQYEKEMKAMNISEEDFEPDAPQFVEIELDDKITLAEIIRGNGYTYLRFDGDSKPLIVRTSGYDEHGREYFCVDDGETNLYYYGTSRKIV